MKRSLAQFSKAPKAAKAEAPDPLEALGAIPYLRQVSPRERRGLAAQCEVRRVRRGGSIFTQGDSPTGVFLILQGRVKLVTTSSQGREQVLHEEGPGVTLAEVPVFDGGGYVGSARAVEDTVLLFVPRQALLRALERSPGSALAVIEVLAGRVRKLALLATELSLKPVIQRLAMFILRESERVGTEHITLPSTRDELAAHIGTVREQASRALSELRRSGVIEVQGRRLVVRDALRLRQTS